MSKITKKEKQQFVKDCGKLDYLNLLMLLNGLEKLRKEVARIDKRAKCEISTDKLGRVKLIMKNGFQFFLDLSDEPLLFL